MPPAAPARRFSWRGVSAPPRKTPVRYLRALVYLDAVNSNAVAREPTFTRSNGARSSACAAAFAVAACTHRNALPALPATYVVGRRITFIARAFARTLYGARSCVH